MSSKTPFGLKLAIIVASFAMFPALSAFGDMKFDELLKQIPPFVQPGKILMFKCAYTNVTHLGEPDGDGWQKCDDLECCFCDAQSGKFSVNYNQMADRSGSGDTAISNISDYFGGEWLLVMMCSGTIGDMTTPAQVEIQSPESAADSYIPYQALIGYTPSHLFSPDYLLGEVLQEDGKKTISVKEDGSDITVVVDNDGAGEGGLLGIECTAVLTKGKYLALKSYSQKTIRMISGVKSESDVNIVVRSTTTMPDGMVYPASAEYSSIRDGKTIASDSFRVLSIEYVDKLPDPPLIPPNSERHGQEDGNESANR